MGKTFQEQLLQLGLVDNKKINDAKKNKHQARKKKGKVRQGVEVIDENAVLARQAAEKKKARTRELNRQRDAKLQKRAEEGRIRQLIEQHRLEKDDKGVPFRFTVSGKIHRVFVSKETALELGDGRLGIVENRGGAVRFEVLPRKAIEKIQQINSAVYTSLISASPQAETDADDPYAEYKVPDDLDW
jgi:uncharacterized protein YaiL (DUF2058 family)